MLKIFLTQLNGYLQKITTEEDLPIEEGGRVLAQTIINNGSIHIKGLKEMAGVELEALYSAEPLQQARPLELEDIQSIDCVLLVSRYSTDEEAIILAKQLRERGVPIIGISTQKEDNEDSLQYYTDVHIDTKLVRSLVPMDDGSRFGYPGIVTALFAYYGLTLTMNEILAEY